MNIFGILLASFAWANGELISKTTGQYSCALSVEQAEKKRALQVKKALDASNFVVRKLAGKALDGKPNICRKYMFKHAENVLRVTCDQKPTIDIRLDGKPTVYPKPDGGTFEVVAKVDGNRITQDFKGPNGGLQVVYVFSENEIKVIKKISSKYLGKDVVLDMDYRKK